MESLKGPFRGLGSRIGDDRIVLVPAGRGPAVLFEERDLVAHFGDAYRRYKETTPRYLPRLRTRRHARTTPTLCA